MHYNELKDKLKDAIERYGRESEALKGTANNLLLDVNERIGAGDSLYIAYEQIINQFNEIEIRAGQAADLPVAPGPTIEFELRLKFDDLLFLMPVKIFYDEYGEQLISLGHEGALYAGVADRDQIAEKAVDGFVKSITHRRITSRRSTSVIIGKV
ncbi:hypothetical protein [Burkholderia gladioli]|uniref:hypothetical protein n=1 Tax=Burkholderia gladioli TaxID=28095 RepID=UPI00163DF8BD|nr:hypothetical protein [Burkholderia gladioli]